MSYVHLFWKLNENKIQKSKREGKNDMLEREIERNIKINHCDSENHYDKFTEKNKFTEEINQSNMNLINFRDTIEINLESRNNNREILEKRLNDRDKMSNGWINPFLPTNKYLEDISNEDKYLRPKNSNKINNN